MKFKTDQEAFWAGDFGTEYIQRNRGDALLASNLDFFAKALRQTRGIRNFIEIGQRSGCKFVAVHSTSCSHNEPKDSKWAS